jgi:hypothetical protein
MMTRETGLFGPTALRIVILFLTFACRTDTLCGVLNISFSLLRHSSESLLLAAK